MPDGPTLGARSPGPRSPRSVLHRGGGDSYAGLGLVRASTARATTRRLCATAELQTYAAKCCRPDHVTRLHPKERFRQEMPASMPARNRFNVRRMREVVVISSMGTPAGLEKQTSAVPAFLISWRLFFEAKPPSNAARSGGFPKRAVCRAAERIAKVESAGLPSSTTTSSTSPLRPVDSVTLWPYYVSRRSLRMMSV